jgi:protein O-GlcNAc transferase
MSGTADRDHKRGIAFSDAGDFHRALAAYDAALSREPGDAKLHYSRANTLAMLNQLDQAIIAYEACLRLDPKHISAQYNRATVFARQQRWTDALAALDKTLLQAPNMMDAWNNRAGVLQAMGRHDEALASIIQVLRLRPTDSGAFYNAGIMFLALNRFEEAVQLFERALTLNPSHADAIGCLGSAALRACDWPKLERLIPLLLTAVREGKAVVPPLTLLAISDDPLLQKRCAELNVERSFIGTALEKADPPSLWRGEPYRHQKLRIGYVSSDFRDHPVANQLVGLLERHDRERFEIIGFANGRPDDGPVRRRIVKACDQFHEIGGLGLYEAAGLIQRLEVDILVDLNGQTLGWRPGIFKYRPTPVSVSYLGYAGTTGADFIDYIVGDPQVTPLGLAPTMSEKIVQLPRSFWPSDPGLPEPQYVSRAEAGLPEKAFVFCCFNSNHKIRPEMFDIWMRLLRGLPDSVLWIRDGASAMNNRFRNEAESRGVPASRIVFAARMESFAKHLGRMRQADLFLDTFPYNAHVTASDALWAGLPVITLRGQTFASRVAAGFLVNLGMGELVTSTPGDYEALAFALATDPGRLQQLREKLWQAREGTSLFDMDTLVDDLEHAYIEMIDRLESRPPSVHGAPLGM